MPRRYSELQRRLGVHGASLRMPLCETCSTQTSYADEDLSLESKDSIYKCPICLDPRQFIGPDGQKWTTLERLLTNADHLYHNKFTEHIPGKVWWFKTYPSFGIGQRSFLIKDGDNGLVVWDCVAFIDDETLSFIDKISNGKGIAHMVVSHPHYYSSTAVWAATFPQMQVWLAKVDFIEFYQRFDIRQAYEKMHSAYTASDDNASIAGRLQLLEETQTSIPDFPNFSILLLGGHFPGSIVLLWKDVLFVADTIQVILSARYKSDEPQREGVASVAFLWSYPNGIPLSANEVTNVCAPLENLNFSRAFGAFEHGDIWGHAKEKILQSRDIVIKRLKAS
ncbi:hypothetical protein EMMF5_003939 [Cystobasidiomycetes sp. EMM_F5]